MILRLPEALLALIITTLPLHQTTAQHFLDLNSLRAFDAAISTTDILSLDQSLMNITIPHAQDTPPTPPYSNTPQNPASDHIPDISPDTSADPSQPNTDLIRRQGNPCSTYNSCSQLGVPSLCCRPNAVCSADSQGRVGCCPSGNACTGAVSGGAVSIAAPSSREGGYTISSTVTPPPGSAPSSQSTVTGGGGGFVLAGSSTVAVLGGPQGSGAVGSRSEMPLFARLLARLL